jgi:hypothetical protein
VINEYEYPAEMPERFIDDDDVVIIDFGNTIITSAHLVYACAERRKAQPNKKMPIILIGEFATDIFGDIANIGSNPWVAEVTSSLAIVATADIGKVIGKIYMKLQNNPYPTQLFDDKVKAKEWIMKQRRNLNSL